MIGAKFEGIIGALLAIPAILVVQVIASHLINKQHPLISS
jgi:predicted PurR-regulated permease PerM